MLKLVALYFGTILLMYLSEYYYPQRIRVNNGVPDTYRFTKRRSDIFMKFAMAWMICFSFLRTDYNDTWQYRILFDEVISVKECFEQGIIWDITGNPFSYLYRSIVREFTDNYHIYFLIPALLSNVVIIKFYKRYSINLPFSVLVFYSLGTYVMYIAALKQSMAVVILLLSIPYLLEKKYIKFYALVFIAVLFHTHAFMFAVLPLLLGKPWSKTTWCFLGIACFAIITYDVTLGAFMEFAQSIGALVAEREVFDGYSINILRVLVYWVPTTLAFIFRKRLFGNSTPDQNLFVNMSILSSFILMIGLREGANLYARMAAYFEIAVPIALPWMINKVFSKKSAQIITGIAAMLYFIYFMFEFSVAKNFDILYSSITLWEFIIDVFQ